METADEGVSDAWKRKAPGWGSGGGMEGDWKGEVRGMRISGLSDPPARSPLGGGDWPTPRSRVRKAKAAVAGTTPLPRRRNRSTRAAIPSSLPQIVDSMGQLAVSFHLGQLVPQ